MTKKGKTPLEIAKERSMTVDTVYNHLMKLVQQKMIDIERIMSHKRIEIIRECIENFEDGTSSTTIKEALGNDFSYGEIRLVRAALPFLL